MSELEQQLAGAALGGEGGAAGGGGGAAGVDAAIASENAALREENAAMAAELSALSPQFFEEIEDLKYAHAVAREALGRYEQAYGPLADGGGGQ